MSTRRRLSSSPDSDSRPSKRSRLDESQLQANVNDSSSPCTPSHALSYPPTKPSQPVRPVPFQQPTSLLTFSYTPQRVLEFDDSAMRYYVDPPSGADLRYGYERWIKRPEELTRLDSLLRAVQRVMDKADASAGPGSGTKWLKDISVVTWRGIMTKILTAPYEERDRCELNVMYMNGTLYIEEHLSEVRLQEKENLAPRQRQQTYYGYSFESWCTSSRPGVPEQMKDHPKGWGGDVDTNVQWCSVTKTKLGSDRLIIGGEVDCVRGHFSGRMDTLVELKTSMSIRNAGDEARFEKKLLKFYIQSFLLGVPEIVVGFRTPQGKLTTTQSFKTIELPRLVRGKPGAWDPQICLAWGQHFLSTLKSILPAKDVPIGEEGTPGPPPARVWRISLTPNEGVKVWPLDEAGVRGVEGGDDRFGILPRWFYVRVAESASNSTPDTEDEPSKAPVPQVTAVSTNTAHRGWNI